MAARGAREGLWLEQDTSIKRSDERVQKPEIREFLLFKRLVEVALSAKIEINHCFIRKYFPKCLTQNNNKFLYRLVQTLHSRMSCLAHSDPIKVFEATSQFIAFGLLFRKSQFFSEKVKAAL